MKIKIIANPDKEVYRETLRPSDFDMTDEEWNALDEAAKRNKVQSYLNDHPNHPLWILDSMIEITK